MDKRVVFEVYDGHYVPNGFFDPGYFVENNVVAWADTEAEAESYADGLREDGECGYEVFDSDFDPAFHVLADHVSNL